MTTRVTPTTTPTNSIARLSTGFNGGRRCDHTSRRRCRGGGEHLFLFPACVVTTFGSRSAQKQSSAFTRFSVLEKQKCPPPPPPKTHLCPPPPPLRTEKRSKTSSSAAYSLESSYLSFSFCSSRTFCFTRPRRRNYEAWRKEKKPESGVIKSILVSIIVIKTSIITKYS